MDSQTLLQDCIAGDVDLNHLEATKLFLCHVRG